MSINIDLGYYMNNIINSAFDNFSPEMLIGSSIVINTLSHVFFVTLKKKEYIKSIIINTVMIIMMVIVNYLLKYMSTIDKTDYTVLNYIVDFPIIYIIFDNLIKTEEYIKENNSSSDHEEDKSEQYNIQINIMTDSNVRSNSDIIIESNDNEIQEDQEIQEIQEDQEDQVNPEYKEEQISSENIYYTEEEYNERLNQEIIEKYDNQLNCIIYEYELKILEIKNNIRLTDDEINEIDNVVGDKLSNRELRLLVRIINNIYLKKIGN